MTGALGGLSADEVRREVLEAPRRGVVAVAGLRVIERPGWFQLVMPAVTTGGLNRVALTVVADDEIEAVIERTLAEYAGLGLRFRWVVDPDSRPRDLAERLARHGLRGEAGRALAGPTTVAPGSPPAGITIERIDRAGLPTFERVMAAGWALDPAPLRPYYLALLDDPDRNRLYLARWHGEPAAVGAQTLFARSAYLTGGVVLPGRRGRGLYRALVAARLRDAAAAGITVATTHARAATSAPILERLGFVAVCDVTSFSND